MRRLQVRDSLFAVAFLLWTGGCSPGSRPELSDVLDDHITIDSAFALPVSADLYRVRDIQPDGEGGIWVLSATEPFLHRYLSDGTVLSSGAAGGGPDEFRTPWSFLGAGSGERIQVWDVGQRSVLTVRQSDEFVRVEHAVPVPITPPPVPRNFAERSYGTPLRLVRAGTGFVVQVPAGPVSGSEGLQTLILLRLDSAALHTDTLALVTPRGDRREELDTFVEIPLWSVCPDASIAVYEPAADSLLWIDVDGSVEHRALILPTRAITADDIRSYFLHVMTVELRGREYPPQDVIDQRIDQIIRQGPGRFINDFAPRAVRLLCGPNRGVWLQAFDTRNHPIGYGGQWYFVPENGHPVGVAFPPRFQPLSIASDTVLGYVVEATDIQRPAYVRLPEEIAALTRRR